MEVGEVGWITLKHRILLFVSFSTDSKHWHFLNLLCVWLFRSLNHVFTIVTTRSHFNPNHDLSLKLTKSFGPKLLWHQSDLFLNGFENQGHPQMCLSFFYHLHYFFSSLQSVLMFFTWRPEFLILILTHSFQMTFSDIFSYNLGHMFWPILYI